MHVDVIQGNNEQRSDAYREVRRVSSGVNDEVVHHKLQQSLALPDLCCSDALLRSSLLWSRRKYIRSSCRLSASDYHSCST